MTPQELKNSILQLAVQGKLVEQRAEEGTAEELYKKIQAEKQKLTAEKKIKKEKPLPEITAEEIPFDIPESWKWVRLGEITTYSQKKEKVTPKDISLELWLLDLEDIEKDTGKVINYCKVKDRTVRGDKVKFYKGQILYSKLRPYLKKLLVVDDDGICSSEIVPFDTYGDIYNKYILNTLKSPYIDFYINSVTYGVKMPRVGTETMINLLIPLPPLEEQKRIVAKIEELLPQIDRYEKAWSKLETFNKSFPEDMQKSILQYAVQGKLVEQRAEEGTAEELYKKIQAEKQKLIAEKKIKKEKSLPEITAEEIPFDIPESWKWVRLGEICNKIVDGAHNTPKYVEDGVPFLSVKNISSGKIDFSDTKYISLDEHKKLYERCNPEVNDILLSKVGTTGIPVKVDVEKEFSIFVSVALLKFSNELINIDYFIKVLLAPIVQKQCKENTKGVGNKNWVIKDIKNTIIPLPPLEEQKRIIAKIEELLPLCENLKK